MNAPYTYYFILHAAHLNAQTHSSRKVPVAASRRYASFAPPFLLSCTCDRRIFVPSTGSIVVAALNATWAVSWQKSRGEDKTTRWLRIPQTWSCPCR